MINTVDGLVLFVRARKPTIKEKQLEVHERRDIVPQCDLTVAKAQCVLPIRFEEY